MAEDQNRTLQDKFMLRLPDGMRERLKEAAAANNRSMNAEIVATLEEKYPPADFSYDAFFAEWIEPLFDIKDEEAKRAKVAEADAYVKNFDKNIHVWLSREGGIAFGVRKPKDLTNAELDRVQKFISPPDEDVADDDLFALIEKAKRED